ATTGTLTVNLSGGNASLSVDGNNTLTLGPATTVTQSSAAFGGSITAGLFAGGGTILNQGLIRNTAGNLTINPSTFANQSGGVVRATAGSITVSLGGT